MFGSKAWWGPNDYKLFFWCNLQLALLARIRLGSKGLLRIKTPACYHYTLHNGTQNNDKQHNNIKARHSVWWHSAKRHSILLFLHNAVCHLCCLYAEFHLYCHCAEYYLFCHHTECHLCWVSFMLGVIYTGCHLCWVSLMLSVENKPCDECQFAECRYTKCRYAECHGASSLLWLFLCVKEKKITRFTPGPNVIKNFVRNLRFFAIS